MNAARLGFRFLRRDWRAGELRLLAAALVIAVTAVSSVAWLAERVGTAGAGRAAELLAADRVLRASQPIPQHWLEQAQALGLATARTLEFPSVVLADERTQLVAVKAVEEGYPLRGAVRIGFAGERPEQIVRAVPAPGTVWLEPRLAAQLGVRIGDSLELGALTLRVSALLLLEPDRGGLFGGLAPRLMLNIADVPATQLVQPASRVRYALLLAGSEAALAQFHSWLLEQSGEPVDWVRPGEEQPGVQRVIDDAQRFLGLGALLTVVIAGVAMLLTVRRYAARQFDRVAIMRCLGAPQRQISAVIAWELIWLGLVGGGMGIVLGFLVHELMLALVAGLLPPELPPPGVRPALSGWLAVVAALLGFALPTLLRLKKVPPLRVLRRDLGNDVLRGSSLYLIALAVIFALMWWQAADLQLAAIVFGAVLATLILLAGAGLALVALVRAWRRRGWGGSLLFSGISRRPVAAVVQIVGVGAGLMALFLLALVSEDLLDTWQERIAEDAPNYFLVNVQPEQVAELERYLAHTAGVHARFYPMVRARLTHINGERVHPDDYAAPRTQRLVAREFNLSWTAELHADNRITAGRWWGADTQRLDQLSVEQDLANQLGLALGDELTFAVAGEPVRASITSLRAVEWDSFNVNFFVIAPPGLLDDYPATFISSFYLPPARGDIMPALIRQFPSVTVIDVGALLDTMRGIMAQGRRVVELMAVLTLAAGLLVLLAALQITGEERRFESALLRSLGASRQRIRWLARAEFWLLGALAGAVAAAVASVAGHYVARIVFQLYYPVNLWLILFGALLGMLVVWLAGALGIRQAVSVSPMQLLRGAREG